MPTAPFSQAFAQALQHHQAGRLAEAETLYREILATQPGHPGALRRLGNLAYQNGKFDLAIQLIGRAVAVEPLNDTAQFELGEALHRTGRIDEAMVCYRQALLIQPNSPQVYFNLGNLHWQCSRHGEALAAWRRALELRPGFAEVHYNLGIALKELGRPTEAVASYERAVSLGSLQPELYNNLGVALSDLGRIDEAVTVYRRALELRPEYAAPGNNLGVALLGQGALTEAIAILRRTLEGAPDFAGARSNLIITSLYHPDIDRPALHAECRRWNQQHVRVFPGFSKPYANAPDPSRRVRIGYVSPDFRNTVVGRNLAPLFREHDREEVEIYCYAQVGEPDQFTGEFQRAAVHWRDTPGVGDDELAQVIREDAVDILVDLAVHTAGNRLAVFARRPAPVQVSFAAYPERSGLEAIPYRMTDRYLEQECHPDGEQVLFVESFWCYDPCGAAIEVNALPAAESGCVTFGCLNNFCKVNGPILEVWARILSAVPESRLLLLAPEGSHREKAWQTLERAGLERSRVEFVAPCPRLAYLALYHRLDIVLDPFPYNGHSTSLDALWMGVPVVTLAGPRAVSRGGISQLSNLGLEELVAFSEPGYVAIATALAADLGRLAQLRATLRGRMQASVLMDGRSFARNIEAAFRAMWRRWCMEQEPSRQ